MSNNVKLVEGRRVWDKHTYVSKQNTREKQEKELNTDEKRKEAQPLHARKETESIDLKTMTGKKISVQASEDATVSSLSCELCDVSFTDSNSLLEHKNSKFHLSKLGMTKQATRSTLEDVKKKLAQKAPKKSLKKPKKEDPSEDVVEK